MRASVESLAISVSLCDLTYVPDFDAAKVIAVQWARFSRPATKGHLLSRTSADRCRLLSEPSAIHH